MSPTANKVTVAFLLFLCCAASVDAYRHTAFIGSSTTWTPPSGATDFSVTLWGGGGGAASVRLCGGSGGGGATILNRTVNSANWNIVPSAAQWLIAVGAGGAGLIDPPGGVIVEEGTGGDGGPTIVQAVHPNGTVLATLTAYGGGGAYAQFDRRGCRGGAGGGALSSAVGTTPGTGSPPGAANYDLLAASQEGALIADIKAGGAGAGASFINGNVSTPFIHGAGWTVGTRHFEGGVGDQSIACFSWGGAAGYNGIGGPGSRGGAQTPPPANSGSGGGTAYICPPYKYSEDASGAAGGVIIEYNHPMLPTPSVTPTRSPTPSITPSPSSQPLTQTGVWFISPINVKNLTPQDDGSVASLWYEPSYKEKWTVARLANGKYTFRGFNGCYLTAHAASPDGYVRCESTTPGTNGQWTVLIGPENNWTFKSVHNTYMGTTFAGVIYLNQNSGLYWTKYSTA
jgi:hypothetical protein